MKHPQIISYLKLRGAIGLIGILFPIVILITGNLMSECREVQESMSAYYFTPARDYFVGMLFTIGVLLMIYRGYEKVDNILSTITGLAAIGIALFPTNMGDGSNDCNMSSAYHYPTLHYIVAITFFVCLIIFSLVLFTKTDKTKPTPEKLKRNRIYKTCGWIMVTALVLMAANKLGYKQIPRMLGLEGTFTFVMEWIFLSAFGVSWITKGEYIFEDKPD